MSEGVLVAGGRGFIGSHLTRALSATAFGREGTEREASSLIWAAGGKGSLEEMRSAHVTRPLQYVTSATRRVVFLSTGEVYGQSEVPFREERVAPLTDYAKLKLEGERRLAERCTELDARLFVLRLSVVYGPGQAPKMLIPIALRAFQAGERFPTTHGKQTRDFVHVSDVCHAVALCLDPKNDGGTYNIGTGVETTVGALLEQLADAVSADKALIEYGARELREQEARRYVFDVSRAKRELGFESRVSLRDGLAGL